MAINKKPSSYKKKITSSLKKGIKSAFRILFDNNYKKIYNVSRSLGLSHEDAEGVVQEVFITLWEKRKHLNKDLCLEAFIMTITKRLIYKRIRSNSTRSRHEHTSSVDRTTIASQTEDYIIFKEMTENAQECIGQFSDSKKQIFMLSKQHGLTNDEIASKLDLSKRTVENQLYRATKELKELIQSQS